MPDDRCKARHYLTRNVLFCHRESGHEGMHRDSDQNLYWHPGAPPLDRSVLGSTDLDAGPLGSGHSPRATGASVGDCGGSVEEPSTHLIHGSASSHESSDPHTADADSPTDQAGTFGAENHPNRTHEGEER